MDQLTWSMFFGGICGGEYAAVAGSAASDEPAPSVDKGAEIQMTRQASKLEIIDESQPLNQKSVDDKAPVVSNMRLWRLVMPYWPYMVLASIGAAVTGVLLPLESLFISMCHPSCCLVN